MDNKKILFVNLSKGRTGELNSNLLGMIFIMKFQAAAMSRADMPEDQREDFCLYVDEFQNFSTDSFATILSEARKYHLNLIVANQYTKQLTEEIRDAVFGNVGTVVSFRVGNDDDSDTMAKRMQPSFGPSDFLRMPNYNAAVRTMVDGVPTLPFSMATLPPLGSPNEDLADALKQLSAAKYGRPKKIVEEEIFDRLKTKYEPPKPPAFGGPSNFNSPWANSPGVPPAPSRPSTSFAPPAPAPAPVPKAGSSFLDDWLAKRQPKPADMAEPKPVAPPAPVAPAPVVSPEPLVPIVPPTPTKPVIEDLSDISMVLKSQDIVPEQPEQPQPAAPDPDAGMHSAVLHGAPDNADVVDLLKARAASRPTDAMNPDTIFIDQEGTLHPKQGTPPAESK